jgi:DNA-binding Xre family transcriptional regulator
MITNLLPRLLSQEGISIRQLARDTGITYTTIWAMVHGERRSVQLEVLDAVCAVLDVQPGDIYRRMPSELELASTPRNQPAAERKVDTESVPAEPGPTKAKEEWRTW